MWSTINAIVAYGLTYAGFALACITSDNLDVTGTDLVMMFILGSMAFVLLEFCNEKREKN
jgi:hypothetical protein